MDLQQTQDYSQTRLVKVGDTNNEFNKVIIRDLLRKVAKIDIKRFSNEFNSFVNSVFLAFCNTELNKNSHKVKDETLYSNSNIFQRTKSACNTRSSFINHKAQDPIVCFDLIQLNQSISCVIHFPGEYAIRLLHSSLSLNCFSKHLKPEDQTQTQSQTKFIEFYHSLVNYLKTITYNCEDIEDGVRFYVINLDPALPKDRTFEIESRNVNGIFSRRIVSYSLMTEHKTFEEYRNSLAFRNKLRGTTAKIQKTSERASTQVSTADNFDEDQYSSSETDRLTVVSDESEAGEEVSNCTEPESQSFGRITIRIRNFSKRKAEDEKAEAENTHREIISEKDSPEVPMNNEDVNERISFDEGTNKSTEGVYMSEFRHKKFRLTNEPIENSVGSERGLVSTHTMISNQEESTFSGVYRFVQEPLGSRTHKKDSEAGILQALLEATIANNLILRDIRTLLSRGRN